jgi:hypothetical protein
MDDRLESIFQNELDTQCRFILIGARQVNACLEQRQSTDCVWFALQGMLISAANASKLLWGSQKEDAPEARRQLRESVGVNGESPLRSRRLRNDFEHFDERLETYFGADQGHHYFGRNIGPAGFFKVDGEDPPHFGHFDPASTTVSFWERSASLQEIVGEAERVIRALRSIRNGSGARNPR